MAEKISCPECQSGESRVLESVGRPGYVRRRRVCRACDHRWSTYEISASEFKKLKAVPDLIARLKAIDAEIKKSFTGMGVE